MKSGGKIPLSLTNFGTNIRTSWQELQNDSSFCDMTLACKDNQLQTHKAIISSTCPLLRTILKNSSNPFIYLEGVKSEDLENLVNLIYQGEVSIVEENIGSFLAFVKHLEISGLILETSELPEKKFSSKLEEKSLVNEENMDFFLENELDQDYFCDYDSCNFKTIEYEYLQDHIASFHDEFFYSCENCAYKSRTKDNLEKHVVTDHQNYHNLTKSKMIEYECPKNGVSSSLDAILYSCKTCDFKSRTKPDLKIHVKTDHQSYHDLNNVKIIAYPQNNLSSSHDTNHYFCEKCGYETKTKDTFKIHVMTNHQGFSYKCEQCNYIAMRKDKLKLHIRSIHDGVQYECKECEYKSARKDKLKEHIEATHEGIRYLCSQCDFKAKKKERLKIHTESVHEGISYSCNQCEYRSGQKGGLKKHVDSVHKGIRYPCNQCDYQAKFSGGLTRHKEEIHEGIQYSCEFCDFKAAQKSSLVQHLDKDHKGVRYPCAQCDFKAKTNSYLKKHEQTVHASKELLYHSCNKCQYQAKTESLLNIHIKKFHKDYYSIC